MQCHCYVCDKLAPCEHWGTGSCDNDHCHATDKVASWKSQRESLRIQKNEPLHPRKVSNTASSTTLPQPSQAPPLDTIRLASNSTGQTQVSRPTVMRPCTSAPGFGIPNIISQGRVRHPGSIYDTNLFGTRSISLQSRFLRARSNVLQKERHLVANNTGMFKRPGIHGSGFATNKPVYGLPNQGRVSPITQSAGNPVRQSLPNDNRVQLGSVASVNKDTYQNTYESYATNAFSTLCSPSLLYDQPCPHSQSFDQPVSQQPIYSQANMEPQVYGQAHLQTQGNVEPIPNPQIYSQPLPVSQAPSPAISLPQFQSQAISQSYDGQNVSQVGNQRQDSCLQALEDCWVNNLSPESNEQLSRTGSTNDLFNSQGDARDKFHCSEFEYQNWFPENDAEGYVPPDLVASEPANFDAGMLFFDFETSWNGLAQV